MVALKVYSVEKEFAVHDREVGELVTDGKSFMKVAVDGGYVSLVDVQLAGKKRMPVGDLLRGFSIGGMRMVYKQMMTELENINVKPIEAVGKEFDPNFHNAVMQVASEEYESGIVAQEFIKGYTYRDNVVRHSMVAVAE